VGYAIGRKDLIKRMADLRLGNSPNQVATAAALAAHNQDDWVDRVRKLNSEVRDYLTRELRAMGLAPIPSQANFVMTDLGRPVKPVIETLKQRHVLVARLFPSMPNHMRVGLGTMPEMKLFLKEFRDVMGSQPASPS
jgi:histidinol-phosphate aminotransferase